MDSVENIISMFSGCKNLENVNLINSNPNPTNIKTNFNNLFKGTPNNIVVCTESSIITQEFNPSEYHKIYCSENWRENQPKIIANSNNNKCYNDCSETPNNKYDYYSKCYQICPSSTYTIDFKLKIVILIVKHVMDHMMILILIVHHVNLLINI